MYKCRAMTKPVEICQIKVTLHDSQPLIWRRIQVRSDITLAKLHTILQRVMGWEDAHLPQFVIQGERYGVPDEEDIGALAAAIRCRNTWSGIVISRQTK
jgi:Plasmid pRiA4b ORF-3-like protein